MSKKTPAPKGTKVSKEVEFQLTVTEFANKGKEAASLCAEIREVEKEFDAVKDEFKTKIKDREVKRDDLLNSIHAKTDKRMVETVMVKNFENKEVEYWFSSDGDWEVVERRAMTESECQAELSLDKKQPKGKKARQAQADPIAEANAHETDVSSVVKEETSKRTKLSAVDGPRI